MRRELQFYFAFLNTLIFKVSGELIYESKYIETLNINLILRSESSPMLPATSTSNLRKLSSQQQWLNAKYFKSKNCKSNDVAFYASRSVSGCFQYGITLSSTASASILPDGDFNITTSFYNNTRCRGAVMGIESIKQPSSCVSNNYTSFESSQAYSITSSPSLPGGVLYR